MTTTTTLKSALSDKQCSKEERLVLDYGLVHRFVQEYLDSLDQYLSPYLVAAYESEAGIRVVYRLRGEEEEDFLSFPLCFEGKNGIVTSERIV